jgi:glucose/arabinose dehydrogenase
MKSGTFTRTRNAKVLSLALGGLMLSLAVWAPGCKKDEGGPGTVLPTVQLVADQLVSPVALVEAPDNSGRRFVVDQVGKIWIVTADGRTLPQPFLDLSSMIQPLDAGYDERGLLGLAFHPDFKSNGKFYVYYSVVRRPGGPAFGVDWNHANRISEFRVSGTNPNVADPRSEREILVEDWPAMNHNGGMLAFGPDGYLYVSMGDGGDQNDVGAGHANDWYAANAGGNAQNLSANLLGKVLRIDVDGGSPYGIPATNPFAGEAGVRAEIYAYGFRNPYRFSFDMAGNHDLYLGDAGQSLREEINLVTKGGNYGWNVKEGTLCFNTDDNTSPRAGCPSTDPRGVPLTDPIVELNNAANPEGGIATTVIGGYVYRGSSFPQLQGSYLFGSFSQTSAPDGLVYVAKPGQSTRSFQPLVIQSHENGLHQYIKGFGQDAAGEVYILCSEVAGPSGNTGKVYKLVPQS